MMDVIKYIILLAVVAALALFMMHWIVTGVAYLDRCCFPGVFLKGDDDNL